MFNLKRIAANRANAQKSSGPKSAGGKERSSQNALKHGLRASKFVLIHESVDDYEESLRRFFRDWRPCGITERQEVIRLAQTHWQYQRAERALSESLNTEICEKFDGATDRHLEKMYRRLEKLGDSAHGKPNEDTAQKIRKLEVAYRDLFLMQSRAKETMASNAFGVGAALCRLGSSSDKLGTILRYMAHLRITEQRIIETLMLLQTRRQSEKSQ